MNHAHRNISNVSTTRSKLGREDIKWSELLSHFRAVQNRHEKSRRSSTAGDGPGDLLPMSDFSSSQPNANANDKPSSSTPAVRPAVRRRVTGTSTTDRPPSRALSPLNPRARVLGHGGAGVGSAGGGGIGGGQTVLAPALTTAGGPASPTFVGNAKVSKRTLSVSRKT